MATNHQGMSLATAEKQLAFASAFAIGMRVASSRFKGSRYWALDTNAGCGRNRLVDEETGEILLDVPGSPLMFHWMADRHLVEMKRCPIFCDIEPAALVQLKSELGARGYLDGRSGFICGDNEDAVRKFAELIIRREKNPQHALGCVLVDPNGCWYKGKKGLGPPVRTLGEFAKAFPKIDIILNLNTLFHQRARAKPNGVDFNIPTYRDLLTTVLCKKHWLVKRTHIGGCGFLTAVGRNIQTGDHRGRGFFHLESAEGREILRMAEGRAAQQEEAT